MNRFVKEYARHKIKHVKENELMQDKYKQETISRIEHAIKLFNQYMLSVDEVIRIIVES